MIAGIAGMAAAELARAPAGWSAPSVGPSIGPCCFAVDDALRRRFEARFPGSAGAEHRRPLALRAAGPRGGRGAGRSDLRRRPLHRLATRRFFSHRRDAGATGRHLAIAWRQEA